MARINEELDRAIKSLSRRGMDRIVFEDRKALLIDSRKKLQDGVAQLQANINSFNGAIEECDYWIDKLKG